MTEFDRLRVYVAANPEDDLLIFGRWNWQYPPSRELIQFQLKARTLHEGFFGDLPPPAPAPITILRYVNERDGLNVRAQPNTTSAIRKTLVYGTALLVEDKLIADPVSKLDFRPMADSGGYVADKFLSAAQPPPLPIPAPSPTPPPAPTWTMPISAKQRGGHGSAGGWSPTDAELNTIRRNRIEWMLLVAYEPGQARYAIPRYRDAGVKQFIVRAAVHLDAQNRDPGSAAQFVSRTLPILREYANAIGTTQDFMIALHNEPNITPEGWSVGWNNGGSFSQWFLDVAASYRRELPGCKIGFPALSPGGAVAGLRYDEAKFISEARPAIAASDWFGVHYYWERADGADINPPVERWREWFGTNIVGTEVGPGNNNVVTSPAVGLGYQRFEAIGVPLAGWVINGLGYWNNADWSLRSITA